MVWPARAILQVSPPTQPAEAHLRSAYDTRHPSAPIVKAVPFLLLLYLVSPIDLIPDIIPVLSYLDDVAITLLAFMLILKLTSGEVVEDLIQQAREADATPPGIHGEQPQLAQSPPDAG
jgi:uncharacterized membrane protein YkvA (DUF1232 family)